MIIGSGFGKKNQLVLNEIGRLSKEDVEYELSVQDVNYGLGYDRTELKNILEYLQYLGYIKIITIGGPLLYGHITITLKGIEQYKKGRYG